MPLISTPNKPISMKLTENKRGRYRHVDQKKFADNYDKIFGKKDKGEKNEG
jgi:hypothetical protein